MIHNIKWSTLLTCIAIPVLLGLLTGLATTDSIDSWYATLNKPTFNPPNYLFGPVWTILYALMGVGLYIIYQAEPSSIRTRSLRIFAGQLALNLSWSFIFFNAQSPFAALIVIVILWLAILMMIIFFFKISPAAAYLQIPYILWVSFATVLNAAIWSLNN